VRAAVRELHNADVDRLVELAGDDDDVPPELAAKVKHADAYGGLEVLAVWLESRRMLLFERFLDRWKTLERNDFRSRLERALDQRPAPGEEKTQSPQPQSDGQVSSTVPA
jgi:hypothetical protein